MFAFSETDLLSVALATAFTKHHLLQRVGAVTWGRSLSVRVARRPHWCLLTTREGVTSERRQEDKYVTLGLSLSTVVLDKSGIYLMNVRVISLSFSFSLFLFYQQISSSSWGRSPANTCCASSCFPSRCPGQRTRRKMWGRLRMTQVRVQPGRTIIYVHVHAVLFLVLSWVRCGVQRQQRTSQKKKQQQHPSSICHNETGWFCKVSLVCEIKCCENKYLKWGETEVVHTCVSPSHLNVYLKRNNGVLEKEIRLRIFIFTILKK